MGHPILGNIRFLIIYGIFWLTLALVSTGLDYYNFQLGFYFALINSFTYNFVFALIGIGLWFTVRYSNLERTNFINRLLYHLVEGIIISGIWLIACLIFLKSFFADNKTYISNLNQSIPIQFGIGLIYYVLSIMFYYLLLSYRNLNEKTRNEAELKTMLKETELSMLKAQINPHFLFNSLNSISSLTITNPEKAQDMIIKLSDFLRHSISHKDEQLVTLKEEIIHSQLYLDIEKIRFGEKLKYVFSISDDYSQVQVPSMILQPLFENAIKHGVYESTEEVTITFNCQLTRSGLLIKISNNFDPELLPRKGNGLGLKNISNRLKLLYQEENLLRINKSSFTFEVEILIPEKQFVDFNLSQSK